MHIRRGSFLLLFLSLALLVPWAPAAAQSGDDAIVQAREALRRRDKNALTMLRDVSALERHPLASWVDYWDLTNRLDTAAQSDLDAFYARWPGSYVEDRLRNDWLLELGKRRDWANLKREFPRFRMNDDREVTCYCAADALPRRRKRAQRGAGRLGGAARQGRRLPPAGHDDGRRRPDRLPPTCGARPAWRWTPTASAPPGPPPGSSVPTPKRRSARSSTARPAFWPSAAAPARARRPS